MEFSPRISRISSSPLEKLCSPFKVLALWFGPHLPNADDYVSNRKRNRRMDIFYVRIICILEINLYSLPILERSVSISIFNTNYWNFTNMLSFIGISYCKFYEKFNIDYLDDSQLNH